MGSLPQQEFRRTQNFCAVQFWQFCYREVSRIQSHNNFRSCVIFWLLPFASQKCFGDQFPSIFFWKFYPQFLRCLLGLCIASLFFRHIIKQNKQQFQQSNYMCSRYCRIVASFLIIRLRHQIEKFSNIQRLRFILTFLICCKKHVFHMHALQVQLIIIIKQKIFRIRIRGKTRARQNVTIYRITFHIKINFLRCKDNFGIAIKFDFGYDVIFKSSWKNSKFGAFCSILEKLLCFLLTVVVLREYCQNIIGTIQYLMYIHMFFSIVSYMYNISHIC
eukprot:TRINITY_DN21780_c0_g3_i1.p1 TRINITY_DN21780_c0_g3~~TRINITY_DN21780_c0_g3_i1.p1  ORF type:complete len:275 (-),score=-27.70 TRINITY_DN21780_c0_g3_i1:324-1148(-)